jgi:hypothetical protein
MQYKSLSNRFMDGVLSNEFQIRNGVRQGGILSPILCGICMGGLLEKLINAKVGCFIGNCGNWSVEFELKCHFFKFLY